jgi:hypothetical protein
MQTRIPRALLSIILLAALGPARDAAQTPARRSPAATGGTVVFAVSKTDAGATMEPVVIYRGGAFLKPPVEGSEAATGAFVKEYFRAGRQYRLLSGGGDAGALTVVKYAEQGCVGLNADVTVQTMARLGGQVQALAVSSETVGRGPGSRRAPTDAERASALALARAAYAKNGVGASLVKKMEVVNLTATDLDRDGKAELVGNFRVRRTEGDDFSAHTLFMIFEPEGEQFKAALTWFHKGAQEGDEEDRTLVDQLDLDGDGVAEVVVAGSYYEANDYIIYKRRQGRWVSVYQGGGGGC